MKKLRLNVLLLLFPLATWAQQDKARPQPSADDSAADTELSYFLGPPAASHSELADASLSPLENEIRHTEGIVNELLTPVALLPLSLLGQLLRPGVAAGAVSEENRDLTEPSAIAAAGPAGEDSNAMVFGGWSSSFLQWLTSVPRNLFLLAIEPAELSSSILATRSHSLLRTSRLPLPLQSALATVPQPKLTLTAADDCGVKCKPTTSSQPAEAAHAETVTVEASVSARGEHSGDTPLVTPPSQSERPTLPSALDVSAASEAETLGELMSMFPALRVGRKVAGA